MWKRSSIDLKGKTMIHERIEINPNIMMGKPVIRGTRITVEHVLRKLSAGLSAEKIVEHHPHLALDDIYATVAFAADYIAHEEIIFAGELA